MSDYNDTLDASSSRERIIYKPEYAGDLSLSDRESSEYRGNAQSTYIINSININYNYLIMQIK